MWIDKYLDMHNKLKTEYSGVQADTLTGNTCI